MEYIKLNVEKRESGKSQVKAARNNEMIPVEIYGKSLEQNISGSVLRKEYVKALHTPQGKNAVFELNVDGKTVKAITKDLQIHPVKNYIIHADLLAVEEDMELVVVVPVSKRGKSKAEVEGGRAYQVVKDVKVKCKPAYIPAGIDIDIAKYSIGDRVSISQLTYPENVSPVFVQDTPVFVFNKGRGQSVGEEEGEGEEGAEGASEGDASAAPAEEKAE